MDEQPTISVIIPVYNTAEYLPRCLDSVLNNTYHNLEVLCINDGSTDNSLSIVKEYVQKDNRIILIDQLNAGVSAARNAGLNAATGDFIAFIDSDDWVHPQYFEILINGYQKTNAGIIACSYKATSRFEELCYPVYSTANHRILAFEEIVKDGFLKRLVWGRIYVKTILDGIRFDTSLQYGEDSVYNLSAILAEESVRLAHVDLPLYFYYFRNNSISNTISYERRLQLPKWYLEHYNEFATEKARQYILEQACRDVLSSRYLEMFNPMRKEVFSECSKIMANCTNTIKKTKTLSLSKSLIYQILFRFPPLYRMIRILDDRTLIAWEKQMKSKTRNVD